MSARVRLGLAHRVKQFSLRKSHLHCTTSSTRRSHFYFHNVPLACTTEFQLIRSAVSLLYARFADNLSRFQHAFLLLDVSGRCPNHTRIHVQCKVVQRWLVGANVVSPAYQGRAVAIQHTTIPRKRKWNRSLRTTLITMHINEHNTQNAHEHQRSPTRTHNARTARKTLFCEKTHTTFLCNFVPHALKKKARTACSYVASCPANKFNIAHCQHACVHATSATVKT